MIVGDQVADCARFWASVSYYNLIQRIMRYGDQRERPNSEDIDSGWRIFSRVVKVLQPSVIVVLGNGAAWRFSEAMNGLGLHNTFSARTVKIGRCWASEASLQVEGRNVPIIFTQHPSQYFSWRNWHDLIYQKYSPEIQALRSKLGIQNEGA